MKTVSTGHAEHGNQLPVQTTTIQLIIQQWEESEYEEGWGATVRPDGFSIHRSQDALSSFIQGYWDTTPDKVNGRAPDRYSRPVEDVLVVALPAEHPLVHALSERESLRLYSWVKETYTLYRAVEQLWHAEEPDRGWHKG